MGLHHENQSSADPVASSPSSWLGAAVHRLGGRPLDHAERARLGRRQGRDGPADPHRVGARRPDEDRQRRAHPRRTDDDRAEQRHRIAGARSAAARDERIHRRAAARSNAANLSRFDRIIVMPTLASARPRGRVDAAAGLQQQPQPQFMQQPPPVDDDADDEQPAPNVAVAAGAADRCSTPSRSSSDRARRSLARIGGQQPFMAQPQVIRMSAGSPISRSLGASRPRRLAVSRCPGWSRQPPQQPGQPGQPQPRPFRRADPAASSARGSR